MALKSKFERIDQSKLKQGARDVLAKMKEKSENFTNAEVNKKIEPAIDKLIERLKKENPDALKKASATRTQKPKATAKKKATKKAPAKTSGAKRETVMTVAKRIRKDGEKWQDALKRAKSEMGKDTKKKVSAVKTEVDKLKKLIETDAVLKGFANSELQRDAVRRAKPRGKRKTTTKGETTNQYGTFKNKVGRTYWESRENRSDRYAPKYPKNKPFLEMGGDVTDAQDLSMANADFLVMAKGGDVRDEGNFAKTPDNRYGKISKVNGLYYTLKFKDGILPSKKVYHQRDLTFSDSKFYAKGGALESKFDGYELMYKYALAKNFTPRQLAEELRFMTNLQNKGDKELYDFLNNLSNMYPDTPISEFQKGGMITSAPEYHEVRNAEYERRVKSGKIKDTDENFEKFDEMYFDELVEKGRIDPDNYFAKGGMITSAPEYHKVRNAEYDRRVKSGKIKDTDDNFEKFDEMYFDELVKKGKIDIDNYFAKGGKLYYQQDAIGKAKYTVSSYDGKKTHKDGSPFYDIAIFKNKKDLESYIEKLESKGYKKRFAKGGEVADINKFKKQLIAKAKRKGLYENFGQAEVRKLEDKYGYSNNVREFDNWAMDFDLSQMAKGGEIDAFTMSMVKGVDDGISEVETKDLKARMEKGGEVKVDNSHKLTHKGKKYIIEWDRERNGSPMKYRTFITEDKVGGKLVGRNTDKKLFDEIYDKLLSKYAKGGVAEGYSKFRVVFYNYSGETEEKLFDYYSDAYDYYNEAVDDEIGGGTTTIILQGYSDEYDEFEDIFYFDPMEMSEEDEDFAKGGEIRSISEIRELQEKIDKKVDKMSPKEMADTWNKTHPLGMKNPMAWSEKEVAKNKKYFSYYLKGSLLEDEMSEKEYLKYFAKGGRLKSALMRDRKYYNKNEAWERAYSKGKSRRGYKENGGTIENSIQSYQNHYKGFPSYEKGGKIGYRE